MNTLSTNQELQSLLADFEQQSGHTIPVVTPLTDLYRDYCDWSQQHHLPVQNITTFLLGLTRKTDGVPCRLSDGTVGMIGVAPKASFANGVLQ